MNRSATYCNLYKLCFPAGNYSFAIKVDILNEEQKTVDLKLQHRISKKNSFSRYLENAKSWNLLGAFQPNSSNPCQVKNLKILENLTIW